MIKRIKNSTSYRWYAIAIVFIGTFMATLDGSIVNVALPTISEKLHSDLSYCNGL